VTIRYSRKFVKQFAQQPAKVQQAFNARLRIFSEDINDPSLRNHPLKGELTGFYSINVTGDVRAIYEIIDGEIYLYAIIGPLSQLYG